MTSGRTAAPVVVKFGGASLCDPEAVVRRVRHWVRRGVPIVIVTSARAGLTDALERFAAGRRTPADRRALVQRLRAEHAGSSRVDRSVEALVRRWVPETRPGASLSPEAHDAIGAIGERLAARWLADKLEGEGIAAEPMDADVLGIRTDRAHGAATVDIAASAGPVSRALGRRLRGGIVPVVTGYFGRAPGGRVALLGRGGSDYSATVVGEIVGARSVELIKPGVAVRSADPQFVRGTHRVRRLSYDEAEELAQFGSGILHPLSVQPAHRRGIPIVIRAGAGASGDTRIGPGRGRRRRRLVVVTGPLRRVVLQAPGGRYRPGALARLGGRLAGAGVPIVAVSGAGSQLTVLVPVRAPGVAARAGGLVGVVSLVGGGGMRDAVPAPKSLTRTSLELSGNERYISWVVPWRRAWEHARALHRRLYPGRRT